MSEGHVEINHDLLKEFWENIGEHRVFLTPYQSALQDEIDHYKECSGLASRRAARDKHIDKLTRYLHGHCSVPVTNWGRVWDSTVKEHLDGLVRGELGGNDCWDKPSEPIATTPTGLCRQIYNEGKNL